MFDSKSFYQELDIHFVQKDPRALEEFLVSSLQQAKADGERPAQVVVSNELGGLYRAMGRIGDALELHESVLAILTEDGQQDTINYATALINLGDVYASAGITNGGRTEYLKKAVDVFSEAKGRLATLNLEKDYRMAALCNNISAVYKELGQFPDAEKQLAEAFAIIGGIPGAEGEQAVTRTNLAELQLAQQKYEEAEDSFNQAMKHFETIAPDGQGGSNDVHYAAALMGLARLKQETGEPQEAEQLQQKASEYHKRDYGV